MALERALVTSTRQHFPTNSSARPAGGLSAPGGLSDLFTTVALPGGPNRRTGRAWSRMAKSRTPVRATTILLADLATTVSKIMGTRIRLQDLAAEAGVLWIISNMVIPAAWTLQNGVLRFAIGLLDPLVDASQVKRCPAIVARPNGMFAPDLIKADHAVVLCPAKLI
mmetsp:Transcript_51100/g.89880  ORF Transcript_51100/g.89880 Transcript_51100/m.89880 type:complete len:167 (-) Transcript_51100:855-1355(-)